MFKLYLMRHADSPTAFNLIDKDRPLSNHGVQQAQSIANNLSDPIDLVLCSSAVRTKTTCETLIKSKSQFKRVNYLDSLYNASAGDLLETIQSQRVNSVMVIAHNPGIHALAGILAAEGKPHDIEKLMMNYHPATLSIFECPIENWADIQPHKNNLIHLYEA